MPLEIVHRAAPCRNVPVTFTLCITSLKCRFVGKRLWLRGDRALLQPLVPRVRVGRASFQPPEPELRTLRRLFRRRREQSAQTWRSEAPCVFRHVCPRALPRARTEVPPQSEAPVS